MAEIEKIPMRGQSYATMEEPYFWEKSTDCSGFIVSEDCQWRPEEMTLVTFRTNACENGDVRGCEELVSYVRIVNSVSVMLTAEAQIITTMFTCVVLTCAFIVFSHDTQVHVIIPIKKVVAII